MRITFQPPSSTTPSTFFPSLPTADGVIFFVPPTPKRDLAAEIARETNPLAKRNREVNQKRDEQQALKDQAHEGKHYIVVFGQVHPLDLTSGVVDPVVVDTRAWPDRPQHFQTVAGAIVGCSLV